MSQRTYKKLYIAWLCTMDRILTLQWFQKSPFLLTIMIYIDVRKVIQTSEVRNDVTNNSKYTRAGYCYVLPVGFSPLDNLPYLQRWPHLVHMTPHCAALSFDLPHFHLLLRVHSHHESAGDASLKCCRYNNVTPSGQLEPGQLTLYSAILVFVIILLY